MKDKTAFLKIAAIVILFFSFHSAAQAATCSNGKGICRLWDVSMEGQTVCEDGEKPVGRDTCPSGEYCCVSKETSPSPSSSAATPSSSAVTTNAGPTGGLVPCTDNCTLCHLVVGIKNIFDYALGLLFVATVLIITIAGVMYMVSSGNKGMIDKAKNGITLALTAFVIGMGSWLMINMVMTMLGFKHPSGGNWWQFTCDTTQTAPQASTSTSGSSTLPPGVGGGISGKGTDIQVPQDGSRLAQILEKEKSAIYVWGGSGRNSAGNLTTDCSGWAQAIYKEAFGIDIPRHSGDQGNQAFNASALKNGTILESSGHVGIYYNGSVYHNSGTGNDVRVVELSRYLGNRNVYEMSLPPG